MQMNRQEKRNVEMFALTHLIVAVIQFGLGQTESETEIDEILKQR
jgi:hypothetical protein